MEISLHDQLVKIQKELKAPKSQYNTFGKYNYRSLEDITEAVKPLLDKCIINLRDEIVMIGDRYYVKATASISDGKTTIETSAFAREPITKKGMDESQITGATSSYARKYALNGLLAIDDTKDADTMYNKEAAPAPKLNPQNQTCKVHNVPMFKSAKGTWYHRDQAGNFCNGQGFPGEVKKPTAPMSDEAYIDSLMEGYENHN